MITHDFLCRYCYFFLVSAASFVRILRRSELLLDKKWVPIFADMQINEMDVGSRSNQYLLSKGNVYLLRGSVASAVDFVSRTVQNNICSSLHRHPNVNVARLRQLRHRLPHQTLVVEGKEVIFSGI